MPTFPHLPGLTQQDGMLWVQRIPASLGCSIFFGLLTFFPKLLYSSLFVHSLASVWDALNALSSHKENQSPTVVKEVKTDFDHKLLPQGNWVQFYSEVCFPLCSSCWINSCSYFLNHRPVLVIFNNPYQYVSVCTREKMQNNSNIPENSLALPRCIQTLPTQPPIHWQWYSRVAIPFSISISSTFEFLLLCLLINTLTTTHFLPASDNADSEILPAPQIPARGIFLFFFF